MICSQHVPLSSIKIIIVTFKQWLIIMKSISCMLKKKRPLWKRLTCIPLMKYYVEFIKNSVPLYSLVMSKYQSKSELIATDKKRIHEFQMKTRV